MEALVEWNRELDFSGHGDGDLKVALQGGGPEPEERTGFSPMQLMLLGMIGCTGMDVISILWKMRQEVEVFEVQAQAEQDETHPRVFSRIKLEYRFKGKELDPTMVEKAIDLSLTRYCPGTAMLRQTAEIEHSYTIDESFDDSA
ncbi:MAG: OsmC family protein [Anaerolineales bacterium]|nr:OsmC family protein [Anaerolineales bacterium]